MDPALKYFTYLQVCPENLPVLRDLASGVSEQVSPLVQLGDQEVCSAWVLTWRSAWCTSGLKKGCLFFGCGGGAALSSTSPSPSDKCSLMWLRLKPCSLPVGLAAGLEQEFLPTIFLGQLLDGGWVCFQSTCLQCASGYPEVKWKL